MPLAARSLRRLRASARVALLIVLLLLDVRIQCRAEEPDPSIERRGPHKDVFGTDIKDSECRGRDVSSNLQEVLRGDLLPYAFTGPAKDCSAEGCKHPYWFRKCRFEEGFLPTCKMEDRKKLISWLAGFASDGAQWAEDILTFKPCDLWQQVRGKTVWLAGDSVSQDMAFAMACFLVEYQSYQGEQISDNPTTMRSLTHTESGVELTTWCFNMTMGSRICSLRANKVPRMASTILRLLPDIAKPMDIVILNFGAWYNFMYERMDDLIGDIPQFEAAVNEHRKDLPKRLFWRECTAQHFDTLTGMFDPKKTIGDQRCAEPGQQLGVKIEMDQNRQLKLANDSGDPSNWEELKIMLQGGHRNRVTQPVMDRLGLETLPIWNLSLVVHDVHKDYHALDSGGLCVFTDCDCSHACSPSWYHLILSDLNKALLRHEEPLATAH